MDGAADLVGEGAAAFRQIGNVGVGEATIARHDVRVEREPTTHRD